MTIYVVTRDSITRSKNEGLIEFIAKDGNKLKRKFRFDLVNYTPNDFGIKDFDARNFNQTTLKLVQIPVEEERIPRLKISSDLKQFISQFDIKFPKCQRNYVKMDDYFKINSHKDNCLLIKTTGEDRRMTNIQGLILQFLDDRFCTLMVDRSQTGITSVLPMGSPDPRNNLGFGAPT